MSNWAIEVRVAHAYCSLSLVSCFRIYELCLKLGTIDPIPVCHGSHTPPTSSPTVPISRVLSPVNCDTLLLPKSTDKGRKRRATHGEPSVYYRERTNRYEPKLKVRRAGETRMTDIWLGDYPSRQIAADVFRVAAFYYGRWDRLNHEYILWCEASLPPIPPHLSDEKKANWIREEAEDNANKISTLLGAPGPAVLPAESHGQGSPLPEADPFRYSSSFPVEHHEEGHDGVPVISETGANGSCLNLWDPRLAEPCGEFLFQSSTYTVMAETSSSRRLTTPDDTGRPEDIHLGLPVMDRDLEHSNTIDIDSDLNSEELYVDHSFFQTGSREGELEPGSGQGVASDGLILLQTCGNQASCHQQDVQDLQQSHGSVFLLECGDVVGEFGAEHPENQPQPINPPIIAQHSQEFEFTDTIRSTFQELRGQGWDFKIQPRISTKFSVPFSGCEGPLFTATNYLAFEEIHEQGFKLILEPNSNASFKDANEASPSVYGSRDRCRSCNAPL
ncbi:hypothetical protein KC19_5G043400 [Ceratodon purpureus]|uniref:Uncharacterized protein n=1 Tax=Ceratodon purpureus TaxID=3225 RepID=A0A8T0HZA3_CERPU|nr:hypothetical protein KC19_5G043400 [Ceratodon purpureus]